MSTFAPGAVAPLTLVVAMGVIEFAAGELIVSGTTVGGPDATYRLCVIAGWSSTVPVPRSRTTRRYCAWAQISGVAEPAALPLVKPIEAVVGSDPYGEAGVSGSSQTCSGIRPRPQPIRCIAIASRDAPAVSPACSSCSARSPVRTGQTWPDPVPLVNHGSPVGEQLVGSGT